MPSRFFGCLSLGAKGIWPAFFLSRSLFSGMLLRKFPLPSCVEMTAGVFVDRCLSMKATGVALWLPW